MPIKTVAPVVVSPDIASKKASVNDIAGSGASRKGIAPNPARTVQNRTTIRKPSRSLGSWGCCLTGHHNMRPVRRVMINASAKGVVPPSLMMRLIVSGGSKEVLNTINNIPRIFNTACNCIVVALA